MHAIQALSVLALAGAAFAAPHGYGHKKVVVNEVEVVYETAVVTVVVNGDAPAPTQPPVIKQHRPRPRPKVVYTTVIEGAPAPAPAPSSQVVEVPAPAPTTVYEAPAPAPTSEAPAPSSEAPAPSPAPEAPKADGYMGVVQEWRAKLGLKELAHDSTLEANALKTAADGNGQMVHQLLPGSFGQVLAPGQADEFTRCFVGGWLCERPNLPGLNGVCDKLSEGWAYGGQTGHADILTADNYSKIGCGNAGGIWACDLA